MYRTRQILIRKNRHLSPCFQSWCILSAKLYNRANYLVRQYATAVRDLDAGKELKENQKEALQLIRSITKGTRYEPKGAWLNYGQLDYILKETDDPAYRALPAQANQQVLRQLLRNYKSYFQAVKQYKIMPQSFTGYPKMPGYKKKGQESTTFLTNQICRLKDGKFLRFPGTSHRLNIGPVPEGTRLKEVKIKPDAAGYMVHVVLELPEGMGKGSFKSTEETEIRKTLEAKTNVDLRAAAIDPGLDNLCAITNNFGADTMVIKGTVLKAMNHFYNKELAELKRMAMKCNGVYSTRRIDRLNGKRNRKVRDQMHKISRWIADWAEENRVDLVVLGHNQFQKQKADMGHVNNQNFVQIPHGVFAGMLKYKLEEKGIAVLLTEESYTSKADYLAGDPIPVYGKEEKEPVFSGKRIKRGLYRHKEGTVSNADINGAANILRKVFPNVTEWDRGIVNTPYAVRIV